MLTLFQKKEFIIQPILFPNCCFLFGVPTSINAMNSLVIPVKTLLADILSKSASVLRFDVLVDVVETVPLELLLFFHCLSVAIVFKNKHPNAFMSLIQVRVICCFCFGFKISRHWIIFQYSTDFFSCGFHVSIIEPKPYILISSQSYRFC